MSNYEQLKEIGAKYLQRNKLASIYYAKGDYQKYIEETIEITNDAFTLLDNYPNDFAAYIIATNIVSSNAKNYCDLSEKTQDSYCSLAFSALHKEAKLLEKSILFLGRGIDHKECATILVQETTQLFLFCISILSNLDESIESLQETINECINRLGPVCTNVYKIALSYHPSLDACKNMYSVLDKTGGADRFLSLFDSLRLTQIKTMLEEISSLAYKGFKDAYSRRKA